MPDDVDGWVLFDVAARTASGAVGGGVSDLGDIVMVSSVCDARDRGVLHARSMIARLSAHGVWWVDGVRPAGLAVLPGAARSPGAAPGEGEFVDQTGE